jgi:hypothetical protein
MRRAVVSLALVSLVACGGGTTTTGPSPAAKEQSFLSGTWRGPVTLHRDGLPDSIGMTTWTFVLQPNGAADSFAATITVEHPWLTIPSATLTTGLYGAAQPGSRITSVGFYASPRGCQGAIGSSGVAYQDRIEADLTGSDCREFASPVFGGSVTLTKDRR